MYERRAEAIEETENVLAKTKKQIAALEQDLLTALEVSGGEENPLTQLLRKRLDFEHVLLKMALDARHGLNVAN